MMFTFSIQRLRDIRSYLLEEGVLDGDVSEGDIFVERARLANAVDVVQRVEPRPHDAAGAVGGEIIELTV